MKTEAYYIMSKFFQKKMSLLSLCTTLFTV